MNEPLLDRKLPERIAYAKEKLGEETEVTITSNGSCSPLTLSAG